MQTHRKLKHTENYTKSEKPKTVPKHKNIKKRIQKKHPINPYVDKHRNQFTNTLPVHFWYTLISRTYTQPASGNAIYLKLLHIL